MATCSAGFRDVGVHILCCACMWFSVGPEYALRVCRSASGSSETRNSAGCSWCFQILGRQSSSSMRFPGLLACAVHSKDVEARGSHVKTWLCIPPESWTGGVLSALDDVTAQAWHHPQQKKVPHSPAPLSPTHSTQAPLRKLCQEH